MLQSANRPSRRRHWGSKSLLALALLVSLAACTAKSTDTVEIFRDHFGTPHVFASSNYGVYYGYGYAVASDRLYQMEILKRTVTGRVAEVLGAEFTSLDTHIRTRYDLPSVQRQIEALSAEDYEILQAYAAGMNHRIDEILASTEPVLPQEFAHNQFLPEPWSVRDVVMIFVGAVAHRYSDFNSELDNLSLVQSLIASQGADQGWQAFRASKWLLDSTSTTTAPGAGRASVHPTPATRPTYLKSLASPPRTARVALDVVGRYAGITTDMKVHQRFYQALAKRGFESSPEFAAASNLWAVNQKLPDAKGIFVNGPQFGFSAPSYVYGIGLHGGDFDVTGNTLLALPALLFAHNNHLGWGSTAGLSDQVDVYVETLNPDNPEQYLHRGAWLDFDSWTEAIQIKGAPAVVVKARRSVHGMVTLHHLDGGFAYTKARAWEGQEVATLMAWIHLAKDRSLQKIRARLGNIATNINFYYMDRQGHLGYVHAGRYPQRAKGHDSRLPAPGTGAFDWLGFRPYSENPHTVDPASGYLVNWNNRPRPDWISSDLWPHTWARGDRVRLLIDALKKPSDGTLKAIWAINERVSLGDVSAPFLLPFLEDALKTAKMTGTQKQAAQRLLRWDRRWQPDAQNNYGPGAVIMETWLAELLRTVFKDDVGEAFYGLYSPTNMPVHALGASMNLGPGTKALIRNLDLLSRGQTPDYDFFNHQDHRQVLAQSFQNAVNQLVANQGSQISAWRLPAHPMQWRPYNFRGVPQANEDALVSLPFYLNRGSENNIFVAKGDGITGYDVIAPGQNGFTHPQGKKVAHVTDQMALYSTYRYKPMPFSRAQVEKQAAHKHTLHIEH